MAARPGGHRHGGIKNGVRVGHAIPNSHKVSPPLFLGSRELRNRNPSHHRCKGTSNNKKEGHRSQLLRTSQAEGLSHVQIIDVSGSSIETRPDLGFARKSSNRLHQSPPLERSEDLAIKIAQRNVTEIITLGCILVVLRVALGCFGRQMGVQSLIF